MSLKIRLAHAGAKKRPFFKIVLADSRSPRDGRFIERLGSYDPMLPQDNANRLVLKTERIKYWLSVGALPTDRVQRFLAKAGMMPEPVRHPQTKKPIPRAERKKAAAEAKPAEGAAPAAADAAPASA